jgi:hypothetical protein
MKYSFEGTMGLPDLSIDNKLFNDLLGQIEVSSPHLQNLAIEICISKCFPLRSQVLISLNARFIFVNKIILSILMLQVSQTLIFLILPRFRMTIDWFCIDTWIFSQFYSC